MEIFKTLHHNCEIIIVKRLTSAIFKMLPMLEEERSGEDVHCKEYIESLKIELAGNADAFPALGFNQDFLRIISIINGVDWEFASMKICRRAILKMTNLLNKIEGTF